MTLALSDPAAYLTARNQKIDAAITASSNVATEALRQLTVWQGNAPAQNQPIDLATKNQIALEIGRRHLADSLDIVNLTHPADFEADSFLSHARNRQAGVLEAINAKRGGKRKRRK